MSKSEMILSAFFSDGKITLCTVYFFHNNLIVMQQKDDKTCLIHA